MLFSISPTTFPTAGNAGISSLSEVKTYVSLFILIWQLGVFIVVLLEAKAKQSKGWVNDRYLPPANIWLITTTRKRDINEKKKNQNDYILQIKKRARPWLLSAGLHLRELFCCCVALGSCWAELSSHLLLINSLPRLCQTVFRGNKSKTSLQENVLSGQQPVSQSKVRLEVSEDRVSPAFTRVTIRWIDSAAVSVQLKSWNEMNKKGMHVLTRCRAHPNYSTTRQLMSNYPCMTA